MERFKADAETMNALFDALAAFALSLSTTLPEAQQDALADNLARLAKNAERRGLSTLETALIDLHRAVRRPQSGNASGSSPG